MILIINYYILSELYNFYHFTLFLPSSSFRKTSILTSTPLPSALKIIHAKTDSAYVMNFIPGLIVKQKSEKRSTEHSREL